MSMRRWWIAVCGACCLGAVLREDGGHAQTAPPGGSGPGTAVLGPLQALDEEYEQGIFFAVLEGLYSDGVQNEVVDRLGEIDPATGYPANFVYACPICMPVLRALQVYRSRPVFLGSKTHQDTFGPGLEESVRAEILSEDRTRSREAIEKLVQRWIERRLDRQALTEAERTAWRIAMEEGRKRGMQTLQSYRRLGGSYAVMKECPACEAGNGACGR